MKDRREGCKQACGGNDYDAHSILATWQIPRNEWLDFVWNINFDEDKPEDEYIKLWLNGKLVVDTEGSGKRVQWQTPEDVKKSENKMTFNFGMYGSKKDGKFQSAYFDEIGWANSCEALDFRPIRITNAKNCLHSVFKHGLAGMIITVADISFLEEKQLGNPHLCEIHNKGCPISGWVT